MAPRAEAWISDPSWENHRGIFENAGFTVHAYPYYDAATHGVNFERMVEALRAAPAGSIMVLHACCHNPRARIFPASNGRPSSKRFLRAGSFRFSISHTRASAQDSTRTARRCAASPRRGFPCSSPARSRSRFRCTASASGRFPWSRKAVRKRRGCCPVEAPGAHQLLQSPTHGGQVAAAVLTSPELRSLWEQELGRMRERIREMRRELVQKLRTRVPRADFSFIEHQRGLFAYSGLSREQV